MKYILLVIGVIIGVTISLVTSCGDKEHEVTPLYCDDDDKYSIIIPGDRNPEIVWREDGTLEVIINPKNKEVPDAGK